MASNDVQCRYCLCAFDDIGDRLDYTCRKKHKTYRAAEADKPRRCGLYVEGITVLFSRTSVQLALKLDDEAGQQMGWADFRGY